MPDLAVIGAGTMGSGIVEVTLTAGLSVILVDIQEQSLARGRATIEKNLQRAVEKGRLTDEERNSALARLTTDSSLEAAAAAPFIIEAAFESLQVKHEIFATLDRLAPPDAVLATNTSSLSVARIAGATARPQRVVGMHFFNPVPLMRLVEVISTPQSDPQAVERTLALARRLGKTPVAAADTPGFIVNRVARPFYLEALRLMEAGGRPEQIDAAVRGAGFRMGPFELMDLIGLDINLATSESLYERSYGQPRFRPSWIQRGMVEAGLLGRKTGRGFYRYDGKADDQAQASLPEVQSAAENFTLVGDAALAAALGVSAEGAGRRIVALEDDSTLWAADAQLGARRLSPTSPLVELVGAVDEQTRAELESLVRAAGLTPAWSPDLPGGIVLRIIAALVNEATFALSEGVASAEDIDQAMQLGANYPKGPLVWAGELGPGRIVRVLDALRALYGDQYVAASRLRQRAVADGSLPG